MTKIVDIKVLAVFVLLLVGNTKVNACLCYEPIDFNDQLQWDFIFIGKVIAEEENTPGDALYTLKVDQYFKMPGSLDFVYVLGNGSCSNHYKIGEKYLFYLEGNGIHGQDHMCSRTSLLADSLAQRDLPILEDSFGIHYPKQELYDEMLFTQKQKQYWEELEEYVDQMDKETQELQKSRQNARLLNYLLGGVCLLLTGLLFYRKNR